MFSVDFGINNCEDRYVADLSFTFLHWKLIEQLRDGQIKIKDIDQMQLENLCFIILPCGNTILHLLSNKGDILVDIFDAADPCVYDRAVRSFHIPFLCNVEKTSPMHLCYEKGDYKTINIMIRHLSGYGLDHHSRAIADLLPELIA